MCANYNILFYFNASLSFVGNSGRLTWVRHSSRKSSATHSYQCVWYCSVSKQWCGCQCWGLLKCAQMMMQAIAPGGCADSVIKRVCIGVWEKIPLQQRGLEPAAVLRLDFQSDAVPTELSRPL